MIARCGRSCAAMLVPRSVMDISSAALRWAIRHVSRLLEEEKVDIYREDLNVDPLPFWRANDTKNRKGITENHHVTGFLAFWDALRRRHPTLVIDCVASGGKRLELEALRRAIVLWRSDFLPYEPNVGIFFDEAVDHLHRIVGGSIIYNNNLQIRVALIEDGLN